MTYDDFIDRVQQRAGLGSSEEAVQATMATLETLGERFSKTETEKLAAQLSNELAAYLFLRPETQRYTLEEFFNRVSARQNVRRSHAVAHATAVIGVLREAVSPGEIADIRHELDAEYAELFRT